MNKGCNLIHIRHIHAARGCSRSADSDAAGDLRLLGIERNGVLVYRCVMVGFPLLSAGILTGAVWAHYAWGSYWSWDPKETWSLITWIIYAIFLHVRLVRGWKGSKIAFLSVIGFLCVVFTYWGVNFLLSGLHSYAT